MAHIVLTRPAGQSMRLAEMLHQRLPKLQQIQLPLLSIVPNEDPKDAQRLINLLPQIDLAIFVSPNAVECTMRMLKSEWPKNVAIGVVGGGSILALKNHGMTSEAGYQIHAPAHAAEWDSEGLWKVLTQADSLNSWRNKKVLFLKGLGGRAWLSEQILMQGADIYSIETYRRIPLESDSPLWSNLAQAPASKSLCILTSSEATQHFAGTLEANPSWGMLWKAEATFLCAHPRIAEVARQLGFKKVDGCLAGDDNLLIQIEHWWNQLQ